MRVPNKTAYNSDMDYIRSLIAKTGLSQRAVADRFAINQREFRDWLNSKHPNKMPYTVQFTIECLADAAESGSVL